MTNDKSNVGIAQEIDSANLSTGWIYDPGWVWYGVDAAIAHDTYWGVINGENETGYIIEVRDDEIVLFEVDEYENNTRIATQERNDIPETIESLVQAANEEADFCVQ